MRGVSPAVATFNAKTGAPIETYTIPAVAGATAAPRPLLIDPDLQPFVVAMVAITARAFIRPPNPVNEDAL